MNSRVRVRFAPSPTGPLHIGGMRTALYNYLFARAHEGDFILRIEDTDQKRYVPQAEEYIMEALRWAGLRWDEGPGQRTAFGPYRQSERSAIYRSYINQLLESGKAYIAFDTADELADRREAASQKGESYRYDFKTRLDMKNALTLGEDEVVRRIQAGESHVIRLKVDPHEYVEFRDIVRGTVRFSTDELDDKVLLKADGLPTYHFANVVDDHLMEITHVIRGEEWLSSTPHHVLLYRALGWEDDMPLFAHLPLIMKPVGQGKLSKRDGAKFGIPVFPLRWESKEECFDGFKEYGFLEQGMVNFLALLGWNSGDDREIYSLKELCAAFSLERVVKSGARFDFEKAKWFNEQHLKALSTSDLLQIYSQRYPEWSQKVSPSLEDVLPIIQERLTLLTDIEDEASYFYEAPKEYNQKMIRKKWKVDSEGWYQRLIGYLQGLNWNENLEALVKEWAASQELGLGKVFPALRLALCGDMSGPSVFDIMRLIGKEETTSRLTKGIDTFRQVIQDSPS